MKIDNEWFSAEFPGNVETVVREGEGTYGSESMECSCTLDDEIGVFVVRVTRSKNDLWAEVPVEKRQELAAAYTKTFGGALLVRIANADFTRFVERSR